MTLPDDRLRQMNEEIRDLVAGRGARRPEDLLPDVGAVMRRYGVAEPDTDGLLRWIDKTIAEIEAAG